VVTVDLLTTGIDVPAITNIVFLRCTKSRILFEQMIGRATRLCSDLFGPGIHKEYFHIYDAVGQYAAMQARTTMKPVVASPKTTFAQLCGYLYTEEDASVLSDVQEQIVAKLRRKAKTIQDKWQDEFTLLAGGDAETTAQMLQTMTPAAVFDWFKQRPGLAAALDKLRPGSTQLISRHPDRVLAIESGYSVGQKPADYLESFRKYLQENQAQLPALLLVTQRPTELTRKDLRELQIQLAQHGFSESHIKSAVRDTTNQDIAASIIGFVRHMMLNEPLLPYEERVDKAVRSILSSQAWELRQRQWLERIGRQMKENVVLDRDALDSGAFKDVGGFVRLNKVFDDKLEDIIRRIIDNIWQAAG
jgi:type I restriction enzyme R subunit